MRVCVREERELRVYVHMRERGGCKQQAGTGAERGREHLLKPTILSGTLNSSVITALQSKNTVVCV